MKQTKKKMQALNVRIEQDIYLKLKNRCDITDSKLQSEVSLALRKHLGMNIPTIEEEIKNLESK